MSEPPPQKIEDLARLLSLADQDWAATELAGIAGRVAAEFQRLETEITRLRTALRIAEQEIEQLKKKMAREDTNATASDSPTASGYRVIHTMRPADIATAVEAHISERIKAGKQPSRGEIEMMRSWPDWVANGEPHPWYGPCDGMGDDDGCSECQRIEAAMPDDAVARGSTSQAEPPSRDPSSSCSSCTALRSACARLVQAWREEATDNRRLATANALDHSRLASDLVTQAMVLEECADALDAQIGETK